jgi:CBS domain-containing protein
MKLNEIFPKKLVTAEPSETLTTIAQRMQEHNVGSVVVVEGRRPVGIVTDRDLALALGARGFTLNDAVNKVMNAHVRTISQDAGIVGVTRHFRDVEVRRLPIVDKDGYLVGIVSSDEVLQFLGREIYNLSEGIKHEINVK